MASSGEVPALPFGEGAQAGECGRGFVTAKPGCKFLAFASEYNGLLAVAPVFILHLTDCVIEIVADQQTGAQPGKKPFFFLDDDPVVIGSEEGGYSRCRIADDDLSCVGQCIHRRADEQQTHSAGGKDIQWRAVAVPAFQCCAKTQQRRRYGLS